MRNIHVQIYAAKWDFTNLTSSLASVLNKDNKEITTHFLKSKTKL
jgi:hypothetical protein